MRHTLFVVLGENTEPLVLGIREYVDNAKMGVGAYFRILQYAESDSQIGLFKECRGTAIDDLNEIDKDGRTALLCDFFEK